jgi:hypothetical protein
MPKARTLEEEWKQVLRESLGTVTKQLRQVLGAFGLLEFTILRSVLAWGRLSNLMNRLFL